jgi:hypothetical protein
MTSDYRIRVNGMDWQRMRQVDWPTIAKFCEDFDVTLMSIDSPLGNFSRHIEVERVSV